MVMTLLFCAAAVAGMAVVVWLVLRSGWLKQRPLLACGILSVALHLLLAGLCGLVGGFGFAGVGIRDDEPVAVTVWVEDAAQARADGVMEDRGPAEEPVEAADAEPSADEQPLETIASGPPEGFVPLLEAADGATHPGDQSAVDAAAEKETPAEAAPPEVPPRYAGRFGAGRRAALQLFGGTDATERAVQAAVAWLVANQEADGRWDADRHGAGRGGGGGGQHASHVGAQADEGVTGLAVLALLGAGHGGLWGEHADAVERGVRHLLDRQRDDGGWGADADFFAKLYCHGIATLAVAEAAAMTGDQRLRPALERAARYSLSMQHPVTGGWRYAAGDRGDTSQSGWQLMALASCKQAGVAGLDQAAPAAAGFLQSVRGGVSGGLAAYRPGERPTPVMTAEALYSRMLLGQQPAATAVAEAIALLETVPDGGDAPDSYTWYYGSLATFHLGGDAWKRWNTRLQRTLPGCQRQEGRLAGSWDPDSRWGRHGGRVYATALNAMSLEVYYRYSPMHNGRGNTLAAADRPETR